jgi:hypothetical protein
MVKILGQLQDGGDASAPVAGEHSDPAVTRGRDIEIPVVRRNRNLSCVG